MNFFPPVPKEKIDLTKKKKMEEVKKHNAEIMGKYKQLDRALYEVRNPGIEDVLGDIPMDLNRKRSKSPNRSVLPPKNQDLEKISHKIPLNNITKKRSKSPNSSMPPPKPPKPPKPTDIDDLETVFGNIDINYTRKRSPTGNSQKSKSPKKGGKKTKKKRRTKRRCKK